MSGLRADSCRVAAFRWVANDSSRTETHAARPNQSNQFLTRDDHKSKWTEKSGMQGQYFAARQEKSPGVFPELFRLREQVALAWARAASVSIDERQLAAWRNAACME